MTSTDRPSDAEFRSPVFARPGWVGVVAAAAGGLSAAAVGLGAGEVVAGLSSNLRSPILDVGDRVVDRVPSWAKDLAIDWFGTNDKIALLVGIAALLALYAAVVGVVGLRRSRRLGIAGIALFGVLGTLASLGARTGAELQSPLPSIVGSVVAATALWWLGRPSPVRSRGTAGTVRHPSERRRFLAQTGVLAVSAAVLGSIGRKLEARFSAADSRAAITLPRPDVPAPAVPAGAQAEGAASLFTPNATFYRIDTALTVPQVPAEGWELRIRGLVERELRLSYNDLLTRSVEEHDITLTCVSNTIGGDLIGNARWIGVRLDDLLAEAGIDPAADQIVGRSVDGYTCGFPVAALDGRNALVAVGMNGEPLPLEHGFPARLIVPGIYGYASATKWLTEIELTTFDDFDHYWVPRGYAAQAPIKMQSRIDRPRGLDRIPPGPFVIGGVAWAQPTGIDRVEVKIDDGDWLPAEMAAEVNGSTWRQWSTTWDATPGRHTVEVRAIDNTGAIQTDERSEPLPDGASGHHTVVVLVDES
ncbi:MAG: molybdopterin-dependent oxidoreductase [Acidimicrobiales bacterium]|nr:molybdopterin-dependent oxidoreductase [Acidimicrobiales bacterium]